MPALICMISAIVLAIMHYRDAEASQPNQPPVVSIESPKDGDVFEYGEEVSFSGSAADVEDGRLEGGSLVWTSDIDNLLGNGEKIKRKLSPGGHLVLLTASDSRGAVKRASVFIIVKGPPPPAEKPPEKPPEKPRPLLGGVCYGPFRDGQDPERGILPSEREIEEDISFARQVAACIRTYGCSRSLEKIPEICDKLGIACCPGAWLSRDAAENRKEMDALARIAEKKHGSVKALVVGNEVLLRGDMSEEELMADIKEAKKHGIPVTTAEIWNVWINHPGLAREADFITVHVHPYWEGKAAGNAAQHVADVWKAMRNHFPGKRVVIGETGWPSAGETKGNAVPSPENQARFLSDFLEIAAKEGIEYFCFELFDEAWKSKFEGRTGSHWGFFNWDGSCKDGLKGILPDAKPIKR